MKKLLTFVLSLTLLTLIGCNNTDSIISDNQSDAVYIVETITSEIVSSADESSSTETSSDEASSDESSSKETNAEISSEQSSNNSSVSSQTSTPSRTEPISPPTTSNEVENNSSNHTTSDNKTESESNNQNTESENENTSTNQETIICTKFESSIGVYETKNLPSVSTYYDNKCPAWIGVYSIGKNSAIETEIKTKFADNFGYAAKESVICEHIGTYLVDCHATPQDIYQYTITDLTYPLLLDDFYVIKKKICADGSAWVGFALPGNINTMESSSRVTKLLNEMNQTFCEWTGYDLGYVIANHPQKFRYNCISSAGWFRTQDGRVLEVVYRYTRGIDLPVDNLN